MCGKSAAVSSGTENEGSAYEVINIEEKYNYQDTQSLITPVPSTYMHMLITISTGFIIQGLG